MRIGVYGAGASGGHLAVKLAQAGHAVSVLARGAALEAIRTSGLTLLQGGQRLHADVRVAGRAAELGEQDLVIIAVKAHALPSVAQDFAPLVNAHTPVIFAQNGMPWWYPIGLPADKPKPPALRLFEQAAQWSELIRPQQIMAGILYTANQLIAPATVQNNSPAFNALEIAAAHPAGEGSAPALRAVLEGAGIGSPVLADARAAVWAKLAGNACSSATAVITGNPRAVGEPGLLQDVFKRAVREAMQVAEANGYPLQGLLDLSRFASHRGPHKPSMLQDYEAGRPMEIEAIVLPMLDFARAAGVSTPTLDTLCALAARLAADKGLYALVASPASNEREASHVENSQPHA